MDVIAPDMWFGILWKWFAGVWKGLERLEVQPGEALEGCKWSLTGDAGQSSEDKMLVGMQTTEVRIKHSSSLNKNSFRNSCLLNSHE